MLKIARLLAFLAGLSGMLTLVGYGTHTYALTWVRPGFRGMSIVTALALVLMAGSVLATASARERWRTATAGGAGLLMLAMLASYLTTGADAISAPLAVGIFGAPAEFAGRTAVATCVASLLLAAALLLRRINPLTADLAAGSVAAISATGLLGYVYGVPDLYAFWIFNSMAVHTAASLLLLSIATIFSSPGTGWASIFASDTAGGKTTRRQLTVLLIPPMAGWLLLNAADAQQMSHGTAMALMVVSMIWPLAFLILRDGRSLVALETSQHHQAEQEQQHRKELENRLAAQALALEKASEDRLATEAALNNAQRMETLGQLSGGIAHDFNNLLMAISGNLQLLRRKLPKGMPEHRHVDNAMIATDKGAKVTGQLLAFSRSQRLSVEVVDVAASMANAQALIGNALGPGIQLQVAALPGLWAKTDHNQLELALLNLAMNGRDAMPLGGTIELSSESSDDGQWVVVRLRDAGTGMSPDILAKAAEPFFTTKEQGKGTGLGLSQVHGFVLQSGGKLHIDSKLGKGTTVQIMLPRVGAPAQVSEDRLADAPTAKQLGLERQAIVIDDDESVRSVVVEALGDLGFAVRAAENGESGLEMLQGFRPDVAVIDFLMPGINGAQVARAAQTLHQGLPIVFISGYADTLALDGISGALVLRKPFDMVDLERSLSVVLDRQIVADVPFGRPGMAPLQ
jgi:signal transduction histidine kinase/ActR/RegA family two-component response regulator